MPFVSVGVNITVDNEVVRDVSGEVIAVRMGDRFCLQCLRRIDPLKVARETHYDTRVRDSLVERGYVSGTQVNEPAVKTLNAMVATLAVEVLLNQYTGRQDIGPVVVYEDNRAKAIYEDRESVEARAKECFTCGIGMRDYS
ncbi:MAG: hypothetical protein IPL61_13145 [Myxococcales bacterium]|nr:hypothetical protein [Myxococcales bacterium]